MNSQYIKTTSRRVNNNKAFSLVEVLMSMTILAMLMAAIGSAVYASLDSYGENENIALATQATRSVLNKIVRDVRTAKAVGASSTQITIVPPDGSDAELILYDWDAGEGILSYQLTVNGTPTSYPLLGDGEIQVQSFTITHTNGTDWQGMSCVKSVTVSIGIAIDDKTFSMTASSSPRRNQLY